MNDLTTAGKGKSCCADGDAAVVCCQPAAGSVSSCCAPGAVPGKKWKILISVVIIVAAIGVGANSVLNGNLAQSYTTVPAKSFSTGLTQVPPQTPEIVSEDKSQTKKEEIALNQVLDSLESLDTLAADKEVVFLVLPGVAQVYSFEVPKALGMVASNLWKSGQKIAVFTLKRGASDYNRIIGQFAVKTFPSILVVGRQGSPSIVSDDISEARLYNAFLLASQSISCCPTGSASCCPK
jgi:hypothetical protein